MTDRHVAVFGKRSTTGFRRHSVTTKPGSSTCSWTRPINLQRNDQRMELCETSLTPSGLVRVQTEGMKPIDSSLCLGHACMYLNKIWFIYAQNMCKSLSCGLKRSLYWQKHTVDNQVRFNLHHLINTDLLIAKIINTLR